jgi:hypothetical protein
MPKMTYQEQKDLIRELAKRLKDISEKPQNRV